MNLLSRAQPSLLERTWTSASQLIQAPITLIKSPINAILAIPGLSFLLIPTFSSYSTSLNLLFFYLTWSTLVLSLPPLKVEFFGTLVIRTVFYILPSLGFLFFDSALPSVAAGFKEHGEVALAIGEEQGGPKGRWWKVALVSLGNVLLGVALQTGTEFLFTEVFHVRSALKVTTTLPMPWGIFKDLFRGLVLREILTYTLHRYVLHSPSSPLTTHHLSWYHSLPAPYSLSAHYDHPLAYLAHVFLPTYLPALLFRFHLLTYHLYLALISLEELFVYSGYNILPSGFILGGIARRQEKHLMGGGAGNFGAWGLCDLCARTSVGGNLLEDVGDEVEEKEVRRRVGDKVRGKTKGIGGRKRK